MAVCRQSDSSDVRPEAWWASFQTERTQNICMLSLIQTYKYELTLMVGKSCLAILGSANSFGIRVCALTLKGRSAKTFPESFRGADVAHGFFL